MLPEHKLNFSLCARGPWEEPIGMETAVSNGYGYAFAFMHMPVVLYIYRCARAARHCVTD